MYFVVELWMAITRIKGRKSDESLVFEIIFKIYRKLANYNRIFEIYMVYKL